MSNYSRTSPSPPIFLVCSARELVRTTARSAASKISSAWSSPTAILRYLYVSSASFDFGRVDGAVGSYCTRLALMVGVAAIEVLHSFGSYGRFRSSRSIVTLFTLRAPLVPVPSVYAKFPPWLSPTTKHGYVAM